MTELAHMHCAACRGDEPEATEADIARWSSKLPAWDVVAEDGVRKLRRTFEFPDFRAALRFTNQVGLQAEQEDHHPSLNTAWGRVTATWWTHKIDGLHRNDFIMAAKCDELYETPALVGGMHAMFYTPDAEAARTFLRDALELPAFDVGDGWLIFDVPSADIGCHPAEDSHHAISFVCDDIGSTVERLRQRGVEFTQAVEDYGWGKATFFKMPGDLTVELYQPLYDK
jgi:4a-hydroxytetrahydrobiopterin dehydratase